MPSSSSLSSSPRQLYFRRFSFVDRCSFKRCARRSQTIQQQIPTDFWLRHLHSQFDDNIWFNIVKKLNAKVLARVALVNRMLHDVAMHESLWKAACLRDLKVPYDTFSRFPWRSLYASAFANELTSFELRDSVKLIEFTRIGSFHIESGKLKLSGNFSGSSSDCEKENENSSLDLFTVKNVKHGVWIADLQLLSCDTCSDQTCEGRHQALDAHHWELFLEEEYKKGQWKYRLAHSEIVSIAGYTAATAGMFDAKHFRSPTVKELLDLKSWAYPSPIYHPSTISTSCGVLASTNLFEDHGGEDGPIVALRITQSLAPSKDSDVEQ